MSDFQVIFKAYLIFKDFSRKPSIFKYFSSLSEPCSSTGPLMYTDNKNKQLQPSSETQFFLLLCVLEPLFFNIKLENEFFIVYQTKQKCIQ